MISSLKERFLWLGLVLSFGACCDQTTKRLAEQMLIDEPHSFFFDTFRLHFVKNSGAFLGLGSDFSDAIKLWVFFLLPLVFLIGAIFYLLFSDKLQTPSRFMVALMVTGGIGNLIDRIFMSGQVTDFMNVGIGPLRTGIFNIADVAIMVGAIGLLIWQPKKTVHAEQAGTNS